MGIRSGRANIIRAPRGTLTPEQLAENRRQSKRQWELRNRKPETANGVQWTTLPSKAQNLIRGHSFQWRHCPNCGDVRLHHHGKCASAERHR